jgi:hypothetical protein
VSRRRRLIVNHTPTLVLLAALCVGACGPTPKPPVTTPPAPDARVDPAPRGGKIVFECEPAEATITVDGTARGTAAEIVARGGLTLPQGLHRFEVTLKGHTTYRLELNLGDKPEKIGVRLRPLPGRP